MSPAVPIAKRAGPKPDRRHSPSFFAVAALICGWCILINRANPADRKLFWDAHVYVRAVHTFTSGGDPYGLQTQLPFVNPPIMLWLLGGLGHLFPGNSGWIVFFAANALAALAIPWLLATFYIQSRWLTPTVSLFLFAFAPGRFGAMSFLSGNISTVAYASLLSTAIPGLRRNRWSFFYATVLLAAILKPTFLALLLLPMLAGARQWLKSLLVLAATIAVYAAQWHWLPAMFQAFNRAILIQVIQRQDAGFGLFFDFLRFGRLLPFFRHLTPAASFTLVIGTLIGTLVLLRRSRAASPLTTRLWLPCLLVVAILANARMQVYDADIALIPALYLWSEILTANLRNRIFLVILILPSFMILALLALVPPFATCLFLTATVLIVLGELLYHRICSQPEAPAAAFTHTTYTRPPANLIPWVSRSLRPGKEPQETLHFDPQNTASVPISPRLPSSAR